METEHREAIQKNYTLLVQHCNIDELLPILLYRKVFTREMIAKYQNGSDYLQRKRALFIDIQMRGPHAFGNLVAALRETGQDYLANSLDPNVDNNHVQPRKRVKPFLLPTNVDQNFDPQTIRNYGTEDAQINRINMSMEPIKICVKPATRLYDNQCNSVVPIYSTHSKHRGYVLIINIIKYTNDVYPERRGAEVDGKNLTELFQQIGLNVESHIDINGAQIRNAIKNFKSSPKLKDVDMVFVIVMGHGKTSKNCDVSEIIGSDNESVSTSWIEEQFDNVHCKMMQKKPKIIMYQMCRGEFPDHGIAQHNIEMDSAIQNNMRSRTDMLISHSTLAGTASHRDIYLGTWYINLFCVNMMNHAHNTHLEDIFKLLDMELANLRSGARTMQTSMFTNVAFKSCYMHPKIYSEGGVIKNIHESDWLTITT